MHGEAAVIVNRIRGIDRTLDRMERERTQSVVRGARVTGSPVRPGRSSADAEHARLLDERAGLVRDLRTLVGDAR